MPNDSAVDCFVGRLVFGRIDSVRPHKHFDLSSGNEPNQKRESEEVGAAFDELAEFEKQQVLRV